MSVETIGFIGLGNMGAPMAGRLVDAGCGLILHAVARFIEEWAGIELRSKPGDPK